MTRPRQRKAKNAPQSILVAETLSEEPGDDTATTAKEAMENGAHVSENAPSGILPLNLCSLASFQAQYGGDCGEREVSNGVAELFIHTDRDRLTSVGEVVAGLKRKAAGKTDFDTYKMLKRRREDEENEKRILERRLAELGSRQERFREETGKLLKGKTKEKIIEWMMASTEDNEMSYEAIAESIDGEEDRD